MLESMRKHAKGWLSKVILGAIILAFSLWGVEGYFSGNQIETVAEIDGEIINNVDFEVTYNRQLSNYSNMLGEQFNKELAAQLGVKDETIQTMINRRLMLIEAQHLGLVVPDTAVIGTVQSNPSFQEQQQFNAARYQNLTRQMGFRTVRDYEDYLRVNMLIDTLQKSVTETAMVSDEEVKKRFQAKFEKRVLSALIVNPDDLIDGIKVSDDQARDWYDNHASSYQSALQVDFQVVEIKGEDLTDMMVTEDDITAAYEARLAEYTVAEERKASHILLRVAQDASQDVLQTAQDRLEVAQQRLAAGESFADVAKDMSDDVTAAEGGSLGFFKRGMMVDAFDVVVFEQLQAGEISDVVRTQFGLHLVKLEAIQEAQVSALADVRDALQVQVLLQSQADEAFRLREELDDALGMEESLQDAALSVGLQVRELGVLSIQNALAEPLFSASSELYKLAFSASATDPVDIIEVAEGHYVALQVKQRFEPDTLPFAEVVAKVYADVRVDESIKQAQKMAQDILTAAQAGDAIDTLAQKFSQPKYMAKPVLRSGEGDDATWLSADVLAAAFRTPQGQWLGVHVQTAQGVAVVYVQDVQAANDDAFADAAAAVREEAVKAKGAVRFARWMASVRDRHDIVINQRVLGRY
ncbi:MAG: SurA N-terminal domain-containing protein [Mariprofundaceae bacterium]|nr:SurA N-terminal domain-containing protein [Mariprofundaceae bacterium]